MKIYIKNMVSLRCIIVVKSELEKLGIQFSSVELGEVEPSQNISGEQIKLLDNQLRRWGLEIIESKNARIVEKIKVLITRLVHTLDEELKEGLSGYLSGNLNLNYYFLSTLFSSFEGTTIEKFYQTEKTNHVKDLLRNSSLKLEDISYRTRYSSVSHMSYQFKKKTGMAPSEYRNSLYENRGSIENMNTRAEY